MKALLIKYHGPMQTKGPRLSIRSEGFKPIFVPVNTDQEYEEQAYQIADMYFAQRFGIDTSEQPFALGTIPNGDIVAVLI